MKQEIDVQISAIASPSAKMSLIADRAVRDVIKFDVGDSSASTTTIRAIKVFADCTKTPIKILAEVQRCAYRAVIKTCTRRPTQADRFFFITNLKTISVRISRWAHTYDVDVRNIVEKINRAEGRYVEENARFKMGERRLFISLLQRSLARSQNSSKITLRLSRRTAKWK